MAEDYSRRLVVRGRVFEAPDAESRDAIIASLPERLRSVVTVDSAEAAAERRNRREFGDRPVSAGLAGAARGATLGLSDVLVDAIGGDAASSYLRRLEEANPEASIVGDVAGSVAPVLLSGGVGLEARAGTGLLRGALEAASLPTRALAGASEAFGGAVTRRLAGASPGVFRGILARATGTAAEGAVEGAVGEVGRMLSERALGTGDPDLTAEMVLARLGTGALLGAGPGGLLGAGGAAVSRAGRATIDGASDVLRRGWGDAVGTELSPSVARMWALAADAGEGASDSIRRFSSLGAEGRRLRRLIEGGDAVYEGGVREIGGHISTLEDALARATRYWREGLRTSELEGLVDGTRLVEQATGARSLAAALRDRVETLATDFAGNRVGGAARGLRRSLDSRIDDIETAIARGDGAASSAEINAALNAIKRDVDTLIAQSDGMGPAAAALRESNDALRLNLEDATVWGDGAAAAQRDINAAFSAWLTTRRRYADQFTVRGASEAGRADFNPYQAIPEANSATVDAFLRRVGTAANDTAEGTFRESTEASVRLLDVMERHLSLDAGARAAIGDARRAGEGLLEAYRRIRRDAGDVNQWRALEAGGLGRRVTAGIVGSALGGPLGAVAGAAASSPASVIRGIGLVERWTAGAGDDIASSLRRFMDTGRRGAERARSAAVLGSVRAYQERVRRLEEDTARPSEVVARMSEGARGMEIAPRTRDAMIAAAARANTFLSRARPRSAVAGEMFGDPNRLPSASDMARFMRIARVVDEPLRLLDDLASGDISPDSVAAVREVYPRLYERIRSEALTYAAERGDALPYSRRVLLGVLLDAPTVPALAPAVVAQMQSIYEAQGPVPAPASRPAPRVAAGLATGTDSLEAHA